MADRDHGGNSGFLPGTEARWAAYWARRVPFDQAVAELRVGDGASLGLVLRYLEERPRFLQSGYIAERMLRFVDRLALTAKDRARVVNIAERIAGEGHTREARQARLLLRRLDSGRA